MRAEGRRQIERSAGKNARCLEPSSIAPHALGTENPRDLDRIDPGATAEFLDLGMSVATS